MNPAAKALNRPIIVVGRNEPVKDMDDALGVLKGFRFRLCIDAEKELQVLGCGWSIVTCQFRGNKVLRRKPPNLRLVVSNPAPRMATIKRAA